MVVTKREKRTRLLLAGLFSFAVHLFVVVPYGIARLLINTDTPVEIAFLDDGPESDQQNTNDSAPPDVPDRKPEPPDPKKPKLAEKPPEPDKKLDKKKVEEKPPEPKKPEFQVIPDAHLKMVDQDQFPDEKDNPDAHYLAENNHRAQKETRATETNLLRNQAGEKTSEQSDNQQPKPGDKDNKIAELQDRPGVPNKLPVQNNAPATSGPLAMRDVVPPAKEVSPQERQRDGVEIQEQGAGPLPMMRNGQADGPDGARSANRPRLDLSNDDYDRIVGYDVSQKERQEALAQRSHNSGRWDKVQQKLAMMRSSLENFTPTVQPGNQTELGTRAHPFAAFIATMHRQIHKFWGFGFLADLDFRPGSPYNDMSLVTDLEITLKPDGTIEKLVIARPSGQAAFDTAAMDAVMSAAPFPTPPAAIKSRDGNVYLNWPFHRDGRQCATDFVSPHILTIPPKHEGTPPAQQGGQRVAQQSEPARPSLGLPFGSLGSGSRHKGQKGGAGESGESSSGESAGSSGSSGSGEEFAEEGGRGRGKRGEFSGDAPERPADKGGAFPEAARSVAQKWLAAFNKGDERWLAGFSAVPFSAGGKTVAEDGAGLRALYKQMLAETDKRSGTLSYFTQADIRKKLGRLPPGGDEDGMVFAMVKSGTVDLVLIMQEADRGWRVVGINR